jgi:hypothetical protein
VFVRNEPNSPTAKRTTSAFRKESYAAFGLEEAVEKRSQFPAAPRPFPSRRGLGSFRTIAVALVSLWGDNPAGADAPKTASSQDRGSEYRLQAEDRVNAGLQTDKASDAGTMK